MPAPRRVPLDPLAPVGYVGRVITVRDLTDELVDKRERKRDLDALVRVVVHRIDFSKDRGGDSRFKFWGVKPVPREALSGYHLAERFTDMRKVPAGKRYGDYDWRDRPGNYTGGEIPYHFLVRTDGTVDQCLELSEYGPHARRWSWTGVAVAVAGDFRTGKDHPTAHQVNTTARLCALFAAYLGRKPHECVFGHTELPDASKDPAKACPGANLSPDHVRWATEGLEITDRESALGEFNRMGVRF